MADQQIKSIVNVVFFSLFTFEVSNGILYSIVTHLTRFYRYIYNRSASDNSRGASFFIAKSFENLLIDLTIASFKRVDMIKATL